MLARSSGLISVNRKYTQAIRILPDLPFEIQNGIWTDVIFDNLNLKEVLGMMGIQAQLDFIIHSHFCVNVFIISRFMNERTNLQITNVLGKILLKSPEFEKLLDLLLEKKIIIQNLSFSREVFEVFTINRDLSKLVYYAQNLCYVYYDQLVEFQSWEDLFLKKIKFLSVSASDDITLLNLKNLTKLQHIALNIYDYPINLKCISKFLSFAVKLKDLRKLDIKIVIDKNLELPACLFEALKLVSYTGLDITIKILDNNLTYKNMKFEWLNRKIESVCQFITDLSMNINSETYVDFDPLNYYYQLRRLKISAYYSASKSGNFRLKNKKLKYLELYYFDRQLRYSLKHLSRLTDLTLNSCDISVNLINNLPRTLKRLVLCNCFYKAENKFSLPNNLSYFKYEMMSLSQDFPDFENISSLTALEELSLVMFTKIPQNFLSRLPINLKVLSISCVNSESQVDWSSMNFSILKGLSSFKISGQTLEYDLRLLPPLIRQLDFRLQVSVFKNTLPPSIEWLDITFLDMRLPICLTLNTITADLKLMEHLTIRGNRLSYDLSRLEFNHLKKVTLHIGYGLMKSKAVVKIGILPPSLVRFEIISKAKETVLLSPKAQIRDSNSYVKGRHKRSQSVDSSSSGSSGTIDFSRFSNRLIELGILEGDTEVKENEVSKINLDKGMSKLKIDNVGNKVKNENQKTKSKIKNLLRRG